MIELVNAGVYKVTAIYHTIPIDEWTSNKRNRHSYGHNVNRCRGGICAPAPARGKSALIPGILLLFH